MASGSGCIMADPEPEHFVVDMPSSGATTSAAMSPPVCRCLSWPPRFSVNGHSREALISADVVRLPQTEDTLAGTLAGDWLGVIIMAPHCLAA